MQKKLKINHKYIALAVSDEHPTLQWTLKKQIVWSEVVMSYHYLPNSTLSQYVISHEVF